MRNTLEKLVVTSAVFFAVALGGVSKSLAVIYNGTTAGGNTWDRVNDGNPPISLSGIGQNVPYSAQEFFVDTDGAYNFLSTTIDWDNFTALYESSFDPNAPLTNVLIANDDFDGSIRKSGFNNVNLAANLSYFFVTTGVEALDDFGDFTNEITGPGSVTLGSPTSIPTSVPEPSVILGILGVAGMLATQRKLKKVSG
ncbi:PEP-CTERM sorting domain-containing protein [Anabaena sp. CCY 0017]|uniref:PEP-CTERM sorting domain-containing protein n=1 Tax=Anabaena sp. CCY 0017 TaxID=3103866 RepID=UPI0039C5B888